MDDKDETGHDKLGLEELLTIDKSEQRRIINVDDHWNCFSCRLGG